MHFYWKEVQIELVFTCFLAFVVLCILAFVLDHVTSRHILFVLAVICRPVFCVYCNFFVNSELLPVVCISIIGIWWFCIFFCHCLRCFSKEKAFAFLSFGLAATLVNWFRLPFLHFSFFCQCNWQGLPTFSSSSHFLSLLSCIAIFILVQWKFLYFSLCYCIFISCILCDHMCVTVCCCSCCCFLLHLWPLSSRHFHCHFISLQIQYSITGFDLSSSSRLQIAAAKCVCILLLRFDTYFGFWFNCGRSICRWVNFDFHTWGFDKLILENWCDFFKFIL